MIEVKCRGCGEPIHPMRLEILPHTKVCVACSQEGKKVGRIVSYGTGEEIGTELEIVDVASTRTLKKVEELELNEEGLELLKSTDDDTGEDSYITYSNITSIDQPED
jgi:hypothetical protein